MFAIGIFKINLNNPYAKFFDIVLNQIKYGPGHVLISNTSIPLEPCSNKHISFN